jgi:hypothetical protein
MQNYALVRFCDIYGHNWDVRTSLLSSLKKFYPCTAEAQLKASEKGTCSDFS